MKRNHQIIIICLIEIVIIILPLELFVTKVEGSDQITYHPLAASPFSQDWSNENLITNNNDWTNVPSIEGYDGAFLTNNTVTDPQGILDPDIPGRLHVFANQYSPSTFHNSGVTEFDYYLVESIALSASGTANAPYIKIYLNSSECSNVRVKYNAIDLDKSEDNTIQQVALHYRINQSEDFTNVPGGYIADATEGPNKSGKITSVDTILPSDANNQPFLELRIMTTDAFGRDEWVGIDDIDISAMCVDQYAEPIIPDCPNEITTNEGDTFFANFSASDVDGIVNQVILLNDPIQGIELTNLVPANNFEGNLTGEISITDYISPGNYQIQLQFTNNDPNPQSASCTIPINVIPETCSQSNTHQIGEIQGDGSSTPLDDFSNVTITGVVTATFFEGGINGFYLQDPDGDGNLQTSDALFISHISDKIVVGHSIQVSGTVSEYFGRTQIDYVSHLEVCDNSINVIPTALSLPVSSKNEFEKLENMLVSLPQALLINNHNNFDRYGELVLGSHRHYIPTTFFQPGSVEYEQLKNSNQLDRIILDDGKFTYDSTPLLHPNSEIITLENLFRGGDTLTNITGILDYAYGSFRIQPILPVQYLNSNPRISAPNEVGGDIKVASFNVNNYFTTLGSRGATSETELNRQRDKIFSVFTFLDADILGLVEIENNETAVQDLVDHLNERIGEEKYDYIETKEIGVDEIKVAIIYKPASVTPVGNYALLDSDIDPRFNDDKNRPSLAQTFIDAKNLKKFTVIINHFKSKSSSCEDIEDPDLLDGAGNCNLTRLGAAQALVDWLATDPTNSSSRDFLIIGDLNAYYQEQPIQAILVGPDNDHSTFDDFNDLIQKFIGENAYTYSYDGELGYLDHALGSNFLQQRVTGTTIWYINAEEPNFLDYRLTSQNTDLFSPDPYSSSDHDPILIGIDFTTDFPPVAFSQTKEPGIEDHPIQIALNAIDEFHRIMTYQITSPPTNGVLQETGGNFTYHPYTNFFGTDFFTYIANNGIQSSNPAVVMLTVNPINDKPAAKADMYVIQQNQPLHVPSPGILENDSDPENDNLLATIMATPTVGNIDLSSDGSFLYEPKKDFTGEVNFSYKASDGDEYSVETVVTIIINPNPISLKNKVYLPLIASSK